MNLEDLQVYNLSMDIKKRVLSIIYKWNYFDKKIINIGKQLIRAFNSVAANLSEGYGRFHYKENKNFCYYSRGSLYESKTWITKAFNRALISDVDYESLKSDINTIGVKLNNYIKSIGNKNNITANNK